MIMIASFANNIADRVIERASSANMARGLFAMLDQIIYSWVAMLYNFIFRVLDLELFYDQETVIADMVSRMYVFIGIVMLFIIAYHIVRFIIDPEAMAKSGGKNKPGMGGVVSRVFMALVYIIMVPFFFQILASTTGAILNSNIINNVISGNRRDVPNVLDSLSVSDTDVLDVARDFHAANEGMEELDRRTIGYMCYYESVNERGVPSGMTPPERVQFHLTGTQASGLAGGDSDLHREAVSRIEFTPSTMVWNVAGDDVEVTIHVVRDTINSMFRPRGEWNENFGCRNSIWANWSTRNVSNINVSFHSTRNFTNTRYELILAEGLYDDAVQSAQEYLDNNQIPNYPMVLGLDTDIDFVGPMQPGAQLPMTPGAILSKTIWSSFVSYQDSTTFTNALRVFIINYLPLSHINLVTNNERLEYYWGISTAVGVFAIFILITVIIDLIMRLIKLVILQILAPVFIGLSILGGDEFNRWLKTTISVWASLFIRLILLSFIAFVFANLNPTLYGDPIMLVLVILGLLLFFKQAPKFFENLFGTKGDMGGLINPLVAGAAKVAGGAVAGATFGSIAGGAKGAFGGMQQAKAEGKNAFWGALKGGGKGTGVGGWKGTKAGGINNLNKKGFSMKGTTPTVEETTADPPWHKWKKEEQEKEKMNKVREKMALAAPGGEPSMNAERIKQIGKQPGMRDQINDEYSFTSGNREFSNVKNQGEYDTRYHERISEFERRHAAATTVDERDSIAAERNRFDYVSEDYAARNRYNPTIVERSRSAPGRTMTNIGGSRSYSGTDPTLD